MAARPISYDSNSSDTENCDQRTSCRTRRVYRHSREQPFIQALLRVSVPQIGSSGSTVSASQQQQQQQRQREPAQPVFLKYAEV
ncbi:hypothetical protein NFI96_003245 [Prochilodus magdalenae]|nr:hypothetical protein NFI96_003245 [Prochilodus magdalenae]